MYKRALEAYERVLGKEHPDTLASVNNLLYESQGRYGEAEPLYKRALEAYERVLGKDTLASVNNLYQGRAEPLYKRALEVSGSSPSPASTISCMRVRVAMGRPSRCTSAPLRPMSGSWEHLTRIRLPS